MIETLSFDDSLLANQLFGPTNSHLKTLEGISGVHISSRGASVGLEGEDAAVILLRNLLTQLYGVLKSGAILAADDFPQAHQMLLAEPSTDLRKFFNGASLVVSPRKTITPKTLNQRVYLDALRSAAMTFATGPAGTGKTYLAVAVAVSLLTSRKVKKLVLTRPAVEAGEKLGFLPGDLAQKINPYLTPLFDALHDLLGFEKVQEYMETGVIEVAPLAFMRGRTLENSFVILDEAQNTTIEQMKMFVTRLGFGSYMAITGDVTQIDLPVQGGPQRSGLVHALKVLANVEGIKTVHFLDSDVIRHPLVGRIIKAYDANKTYSR